MKIHVYDNGKLEQIDMTWICDKPNPVYKCTKCNKIIDSTMHDQFIEEDVRS